MTTQQHPISPLFNMDEIMTKEDWDYYFECRRTRDIEISDEENLKIAIECSNMLDNGVSSNEVIEYAIKKHYALSPMSAFSTKHVGGFKAIQDFNLSKAKARFPQEF